MKKKLTIIFLTLLSIFSLTAEDRTKEEKFFIDYTIHHDATQDRIKLLHNKSNLKKLGTEVVTGKISGSLTYKTAVKGMSGIVTMTWDNFSDEEGWIFNGKIITHANMNGDGNLEGQINVSGNQTGSVNYDNIILIDSKAGDGYYNIQLDNNAVTAIPYTLYFEALKK